jgi:site-specific recombinase
MHVRALSLMPGGNRMRRDDDDPMTLSATTVLRQFVEASRTEGGAVAVHRLKAALFAQPPSAAIARVIVVLQSDAALRDAFADAIDTLLASRRHRFLYAETGVLEPTSFARTLRSRLGARLLPHVADPALLRDLFASTFERDADIDAVQSVPLAQWVALFDLVAESPAFVAGAAQSARECDAAIAMLAARAAGLAVDPDRVRYDHAVRGSEAANEADVLELPAAARRWILAHAQDAQESPKELLRRLASAQDAVETLRGAAPLHGTSLALTHSLHAAHQTLERLRALVLIRATQDAGERSTRAATLFVELVDAQRTEQSLRHVFSQVADDVALQITEHASETGQHYVTDDRPQWWHMLRVAGGAGVIVGVMALLKVFVTRAHLAPLWETLAICLNYGLGFVLIHLLQFTVATKQPAMTATLLAARLDQEDATPAGAARLADLIVRTVRTQVVAIVGNVVLAVPTALLVVVAFRAATGESPVPVPKAQHMLEELHPWASWALLHAAIAGVCLFLSGVISGYYDNLCVFGRVGARLAVHPVLLRLLKPVRTARLARYIEDNLGALLGNLSFGFMLGGVGFIGFLTGLPIDIRHVAFASANTAYALGTLRGHESESAAAFAVVGVLLVGIVNVAVSYGLAFATAFRARRVRYERAGLVLRLVFKRLLRRPHDFVWPPRVAAPAES